MPRPEKGGAADRPTPDAIVERRARAYELHLQGASVRNIAELLGVPRATVGDDIKAARDSATWDATLSMRKGASARQHAVLQEHRRLYYEAARGVQEIRRPDDTIAVAQREPDPELADKLAATIVSMEAQLAKLEGTNAPTLQRVTVISNEDINAAIAERRRQLAEVNPAHPLLRRVGEQPAIGPG